MAANETTKTTSDTTTGTPNDESLQCQGQVKVGSPGLTLTLKSKYLDQGKWTINPPSILTGPGEANWLVQGRSQSALGTDGNCVYVTPDGAEIVMGFVVRRGGSPTKAIITSSATITSSGTTAGEYAIHVSPVPSDGRVITPVYTVNYK